MISEKYFNIGNRKAAIRALFEYGKERAKEVGEENVFDYSIGNPASPVPACFTDRLISLAASDNSLEVHGYSLTAGDLEFRRKLAEYENSQYGVHATPRQFFITSGAAPALTISLACVAGNAGDEVLLQAPFFPEYRTFIANAGAKAVIITADYQNFQINFGDLEEKISEHTKAMIINSPNNPSGVIYSEESLIRLAEILKRKEEAYGHPIYLISDEPYRELVFDETATVPYLPGIYANTIVCYSYSKALSIPGERVGYIYVPENVEDGDRLITACAGAARSFGHVCAPSIMQKAVADCIGKTSDMSIYRKNRELLCEKLTSLGFELVKPQGAFYIFAKALETDAQHFSDQAKEYNLLLVPGDAFGCPGYLRISYCVSTDMILRSFGAFEELCKEYGREE